jgi:hypothetical protein
MKYLGHGFYDPPNGFEREVRDGKPYFGKFFGSFIAVNFSTFDVIIEQCKEKLFLDKEHFIIINDLESRHEEYIFRTPWRNQNSFCDFYPLNQNGTIGFKFLAWGRAFKVMRTLRKGVPRYKKGIFGGKRKRKRIA